MWVEPKKMDDPAIFQTALVEGGFDADRIFGLIETQEIKQELIRNTERSVERGTFGSPTFYVGNEIFFGKDRLSAVEKKINQAKEVFRLGWKTGPIFLAQRRPFWF